MVEDYWSSREIQEYFKTKKPNELMLQWLNGESPDGYHFHRILDAGCGYGRNLLPFQQVGAVIYGFDTCENAVIFTRQRLVGCISFIIKGSIEECPWHDHNFDLVICDGVLHQLANNTDFMKALRYLSNVVSPGSLLFFSIFTGDIRPENSTQITPYIWRNQYGARMFLKNGSELLEDLKKFYEVVICKMEKFELDVGERSNLSCLLKKKS